MKKSSKFQVPSCKEAPNPKPQGSVRVSERQARWFERIGFNCAIIFLIFMRITVRNPIGHPTSCGIRKMKKILGQKLHEIRGLRGDSERGLLLGEEFFWAEWLMGGPTGLAAILAVEAEQRHGALLRSHFQATPSRNQSTTSGQHRRAGRKVGRVPAPAGPEEG